MRQRPERGWRFEDTIQLGCGRCIRHRLLAGSLSFVAAPRVLPQLLRAPLRFLAPFANLFWALALPILGPTTWLRDALLAAGWSVEEYRRGFEGPASRRPLTPDEAGLVGRAMTVLLEEVCFADGDADEEEWRALRGYLRYFWVEQPAIYALIDPGPRPRGAPSASAIEDACARCEELLGESERWLLLHMLLGVAEQSGGVVHAESLRVEQLAAQCGVPAADVQEVLGALQDEGVWRGRAASSAAPDASEPPRRAWSVLGVPPGAGAAQVRKRYLELVRKHHPDRHAHLGPAMEAQAERRMKEVVAAYQEIRRQSAGSG